MNATRSQQALVIKTHRKDVAEIVRALVPWPEHHADAEQEGVIGLLVALEKFDPSRGVPFEVFAEQWIRNEIQRWMDVGVYWRPVEVEADARCELSKRIESMIEELRTIQAKLRD